MQQSLHCEAISFFRKILGEALISGKIPLAVFADLRNLRFRRERANDDAANDAYVSLQLSARTTRDVEEHGGVTFTNASR